MAQYAQNTSVSTEKSKMEIERTLTRYGATSFMYGTNPTEAVIAFEAKGRRIVFRLPMPAKTEKRFTHVKRGSFLSPRSESASLAAWEQAGRQRWRALALAIKAKLEAVEAGITTFEDEFLAHIMLPDGRTVGEHTRESIAVAYEGGDMPPLLAKPQ